MVFAYPSYVLHHIWHQLQELQFHSSKMLQKNGFSFSNGHHAAYATATSGFSHRLACKGARPHQCHANAPGAWCIESPVNAPRVPKGVKVWLFDKNAR